MEKFVSKNMKSAKLAACISTMLGLPLTSEGADIFVDAISLAVAEDGQCSLAEAIDNANLDNRGFPTEGECASGSGGDQLILPSQASGYVGDSLPTISSAISIQGNDSEIRTGADLFLVESGGNLTIDNLKLRGSYFEYNSAIITEAQSSTKLSNVTIQRFEGTAIRNTGRLQVEDSTIDRNSGVSIGGIENSGILNIANSVVSNNTIPGFGGTGGLLNLENGTVEISQTLFSNNTTGSQVGEGGGIENYGELKISHSTFADNRARRVGGAIFNAGSLTLSNSTFFRNHAPYDGGAIFNRYDGELELAHCTFDGNFSLEGTNTLFNGGVASVVNSILSGGMGDSVCANDGTLNTNVANWIADGSCSPAFEGDPGLEGLRNNGGATPTSGLLPSSDAIDLGSGEYCLLDDQRGFARSDGACDLGAFEFVDAIVTLGFEAK